MKFRSEQKKQDRDKKFVDNFEPIDTNGNGELTQTELQAFQSGTRRQESGTIIESTEKYF